MKKIALFALLVFGTSSWATASPSEYPINVHVSASHWVQVPWGNTSELWQLLNVTVDGKKYELMGDTYGGNPRKVSVLTLGDYKAKLVRDEHTRSYEFSQTYEFLFPDNKTSQFSVIGQTE